MRWLIRIVAGLALVALLAVLAGFFLPDTYRVERSAVIAAPPGRRGPAGRPGPAVDASRDGWRR